MADQDKNRPDFTTKAYYEMRRPWEILRDTVSGTLRMREKGTEYLPMEPGEQPEHYRYRRERAIFFNAVDRTLNALVGMVFRNEPSLSDNVPEIIRGREASAGQAAVEGEWENIDNEGTHGSVFCKEVFNESL